MPSRGGMRIVKRDDSLRSVQQKGVRMRVLYENRCLEVSATEIDPENSVGSHDLWDFTAIHFVTEGAVILHDSDFSMVLLPGDSISLQEGKEYRVSNPFSSRSVIWSLLVKKSEPESSADR
jgi:mannose-6-phosphate isomerase-like protein (cupin superfamily)